ncbi:LysR family transcriptional regulator [Dactylosporangium sucinum]|uniref:LysR family transcriptional regulator n=1 Tax=Dactylosporangium sucinum TaxID=1424081 RepID=A0A917X3S1_9ACTN|nr:LysR substrate-binding domain-containing protein [Dactylosporangium sucinum]GGM66955.1 LysR family transcriptional regulator [Dactylosporangium sucinum]
MLDPWRLRLLSLLEGLGTVRAVAEAARLSPSTVSQQLGVLEREVGARLFERAGRRLRLTPAGVALVRHARVILDQMDAARAEAVTLDSGLDGGEPAGRVRVGAFTSAVNTFVIAAARTLRDRHPRLRVDVRELDLLDSVPALRRGECDVAVTALDGSPADPGVTHTPLIEDAVVLVTSADAVVAGPADLADFRDHVWSAEVPGSWTHELIMRAGRRAGFEPDLGGVFASYGSLLAHVEAGLSVTLLPELAVDPRYRVLAVALREPLVRHVTAAVRASSATRPAVAAVVHALAVAAAG